VPATVVVMPTAGVVELTTVVVGLDVVADVVDGATGVVVTPTVK
jgi:hypothetical protein